MVTGYKVNIKNKLVNDSFPFKDEPDFPITDGFEVKMKAESPKSFESPLEVLQKSSTVVASVTDGHLDRHLDF